MMEAPSVCNRVMWPQNCWASGSEMMEVPCTRLPQSDVAAELLGVWQSGPTSHWTGRPCTSGPRNPNDTEALRNGFRRQKHHGIAFKVEASCGSKHLNYLN